MTKMSRDVFSWFFAGQFVRNFKEFLFSFSRQTTRKKQEHEASIKQSI